MTSKEALERLQLDDVVGGVESASRSAELTRRSSGQSSVVSGRAQGGPPPAPSEVLPPPLSMDASGVQGAELLESGELEDLEITPNINRADTMPEWMLQSQSAAVLPTRPTSRLAQNRRSGWRTAGVLMLALVAAGTWWFAADGVKALNPAAPAVVAAAPVVSAAPAPMAEPPAAPMVVDAIPSATPKNEVNEVTKEPTPKKARARRAGAQAANNLKARPKRKARNSAKPAPAAPPAAPVERGTVTGLMVGAAASGRSCRSVGNLIAASEHERVNVCFKVQRVGSLSGVVVQWRHNGKVVRSTEHDLPSSAGPHAIRAFARVQSAKSGPWSVQVRTRGGKVLASKKFSVGM